MKEILANLLNHKTLSKQEAKQVLYDIAANKFNNSHVAAFLTVFMMRSITVDELEGFRDALLELCIPVDLAAYDPVDLCGTGGDGKDTFNISTLASFVVAGAGVKVAKHGNYGVSSACGSSNVLEHLGYQFTNDIGKLKSQIENAGICFLHAPLFHPAMKSAAPIRRELGLKTFFNMLGPMVNPSFPKKQLTGTFSLELARLYSYLLQQTDKRYAIVHGLEGYDEISLTGEFKYITRDEEAVHDPSAFGFKTVKQEDIYGGSTVDEAADIFYRILNREGTEAQNHVVIANAAMAIKCSEELSLEDAVAKASESLDSGSALNSFKKMVAQ